ncbi:MAG TPA: hypothetical protein VED01_05150 [Burkholderiales bacterium]|nr:hypothetical protein [Burkholderiales bacterium]
MSNPDVHKARIEKEFQREVSWGALLKIARNLFSQEDVRLFFRELRKRDQHRRMHAVYDRATLVRGANMMWLFGALFVTAAAGLAYVWRQPDLPSVWTYVLVLITLIGAWGVIAGWKLRTDDNLPYLLKASDITEARANLEQANELHQNSSGPLARQILMLVLTFDWAWLLLLTLPVIAPALTPNQHLLVMIVAAPFFGFVMLKYALEIERSCAVIQVRWKHWRLLEEKTPETLEVAANFRRIYDSVVTINWQRPSWIDYVPVAFKLSLVIFIMSAAAAARIYAGEQEGWSTGVTIGLTVLAIVLFLGTIMWDYSQFSLLDEARGWRRIVDRFGTAEKFELEMAARAHACDADILAIRRRLKDAYLKRHARDPRHHERPAINFNEPDDPGPSTVPPTGAAPAEPAVARASLAEGAKAPLRTVSS